MKERWAMCRTANLMPGDVIWLGIEFTLATVKPRMRIHIQGKTGDGRGTIEAELPRDMYVCVRKNREFFLAIPVCEGFNRNVQTGRTVLGAPPVMPTPPPLRYEKQPDSFWQTLKDWLNGR